MNNKDNLDEINESLKQIADAMKPKPKKTNYVVIMGWIVIGVLTIYAIYYIEKIFTRI